MNSSLTSSIGSSTRSLSLREERTSAGSISVTPTLWRTSSFRPSMDSISITGRTVRPRWAKMRLVICPSREVLSSNNSGSSFICASETAALVCARGCCYGINFILNRCWTHQRALIILRLRLWRSQPITRFGQNRKVIFFEEEGLLCWE